MRVPPVFADTKKPGRFPCRATVSGHFPKRRSLHSVPQNEALISNE